MRAGIIATDRLVLQPLRVEDAGELAVVLGNPALHEFTGGSPPTPEELRDRHVALVAGSGHDHEEWLNWTVRLSTGAAIGTVQATVVTSDASSTAHVAWTIGVPWQNRGYAAEAATALVEWLVAHDVDAIVAHIHPDHHASAGVARRVGLGPTGAMVDGEVVWSSNAPDRNSSDQSV